MYLKFGPGWLSGALLFVGVLVMANGEVQGPYCLWYASFLLHVLSFGYVLMYSFESFYISKVV